MEISLLNHTPLDVCARAIRQCHDSVNKMDCGPKDRALISRVGNKMKHASVLEHLNYNFEIKGISRACLQELARHRISSFTVKSSRYTLGELKNETPFVKSFTYSHRRDSYSGIMRKTGQERAEKYIVQVTNPIVHMHNIVKLDMLRVSVQAGIPNDISKFELPECYKVNLSWSINARSLQNFLALRTTSSALWEIQMLAEAIFDALPEEHKYLFEDMIHE